MKGITPKCGGVWLKPERPAQLRFIVKSILLVLSIILSVGVFSDTDESETVRSLPLETAIALLSADGYQFSNPYHLELKAVTLEIPYSDEFGLEQFDVLLKSVGLCLKRSDGDLWVILTCSSNPESITTPVRVTRPGSHEPIPEAIMLLNGRFLKADVEGYFYLPRELLINQSRPNL